MREYDCVVVGAGNGGMSAACKLACNGKKVLLIEKHNLPGGCASSFVRGRFEFETALHEMYDWGNDDNIGDARRLVEGEYGVKLPWYEVPDTFRAIGMSRSGKRMDFTMPTGRRAFIDKMEEYVPGSRTSMEKYFDLADEIIRALGYLNSQGGIIDSKYMQEHYPNFLRTASYPSNRVFRKIGIPEDAIDILNVYWTYIGTDCDRMTFMHNAAMVSKYVIRGAHIPDGTSHKLSSTFIKRFEEMGGEVWFHTELKKIHFKDKKVCGVETTAGKVKTDHVICNINPHIVYANLMPKKMVPKRELQLANARKHSGRAFTIYLGLNQSPEELGIKDYSIFITGTLDTVDSYHRMKRLETNDYSIFLCYNVVNPNASPQGTTMCSFTKFYSDEVWGDIAQNDYFKKKTEIAEKTIAEFERETGILLRDSIEEIEVASPWTFARYVGTPQGTMYGYEMEEWDSIMARLMSLNEDYKIPGLHFAGAFGARSDGYAPTWQCGELAAKLTMRDMQKGGN